MNIPTRFEDEFPEEAEILMKLCSNKELRERVQWHDARNPRSERLYPHLRDIDLGILGWKYWPLGGGSKSTPYKRITPKVNRNAPCTCGSGKKFKKCCINA